MVAGGRGGGSDGSGCMGGGTSGGVGGATGGAGENSMVSSTTGGVTASTVTCRRVPRLAGVVAVRIVEMPDAVLLSGVAMVTSTTTLAARTPMATVEGSTSKTAAIE